MGTAVNVTYVNEIVWATAANFAKRYGPLWWIGYALWATDADLVIRYGPLWQIWLCAMGQCAE